MNNVYADIAAINKYNQLNQDIHKKFTKTSQIIFDDMDEKIKKNRLEFYERVDIVNEDFSRS